MISILKKSAKFQQGKSDYAVRGHLPGDDRSRREKVAVAEGRIGSGGAIAFGSVRS